MKIKTKLRLGFGFLFVIVIFFGAVSLFFINGISESSKVILRNNYESLNYTRNMRAILDESSLPLPFDAAESFRQELNNEAGNITEKGEKEVVGSLKSVFAHLIAGSSSLSEKQQAERQIRRHLRRIDEINMQAIVRKNEVAQQSVRRSIILMSATGAVTFLILFSFIVNFPGFVANPLREVLEGIREISKRNYRQRLLFRTNDEFSELASAFNEMAGRLNEWENSNLAKVLSEKSRIEAIIEQMQDAIIGLNEKQEVLFINAVAEQVLNLKSEEVEGRNAADLISKNDLFNHVLSNNKMNNLLKIYTDGKESYFQREKIAISVPNLDEPAESSLVHSRKPVGTVYVLRNITQFKELDEAKTNFIATVSHELKTPISSIKMSLKLLRDERVGSMNEEQYELIQHIGEDIDRLLKITSELLDLSQVETGNIQLNFTDADPNEIVSYAIDAVKMQAEQKNIQLEVISRRTHPRVYADLEKTAWVLINFLSNALRYSQERSRVVIQVIAAGEYLEFSVRDFGKGIDEQYKKKLFDRYFQVPTDGTNKSGSGLGLAISKDFIEAQKGEIFVESELGAGSRFGFRIPLSS